ncbi:hypothetical protein HYFRA_00008178 [Hymenoscyphus fraxineus]|uniref:Rhodopsin domain-containing protein n=1 Tax=Hymenoscyphus fraxineus TaxID=746836 RepID=A0A9N9L7D7_9HELO|nr:hypothetical protein HYFRA_00008178 [Hymenoscyphus fraxineus]
MAIVSSDHHGPLINVGMWILLVPMGLCVLVKIYTKWEMVNRLQLDDFLLIFAMLAAVGQIVATSAQVEYGLGQNQTSLSYKQVEQFFLAQYVGQIMYILAIFIAKLVGLYFFLCLTAHDIRRRFVQGAMIFVGIWLFVSMFVVGLQCQTPKPWISESNHCINQRVFWVVFAVIDGLTQILVGLLPIYLLQGLNMHTSKKMFSMLSFSPNLITLSLIVLRLKYLYTSFHSQNYTWDSFNLALVTNIHASTSIIAASIPFTKLFIDSLVLSPHIVTDGTRGVVSSARPTQRGSVVSTPKPRRSPEDQVKWPGSNLIEHVTAVTSIKADSGWEELQEYNGSNRDKGSEERIVIRQTTSTTVTFT